MKAFFFASFIFVTLVSQAQSVLFDCANTSSKNRITIYAVGNYQAAVLVYGNQKMNQPAVVEYHSGESARRNQYARLLADKVLRLDWSKVATVLIAETGNFADDFAGTLGVEFFDLNKKSLAKGMLFGWSGPLECH
jgi:hypothetical protein